MKTDDDPEDDTFIDVLFIFLEHQRPASADLYESITNKVKAIHPRDFPGENIVKLAQKMRPEIQQLVKARAWDSKNNIHICRILTEAGGNDNHEYKGHVLATRQSQAQSILAEPSFQSRQGESYVKEKSRLERYLGRS